MNSLRLVPGNAIFMSLIDRSNSRRSLVAFGDSITRGYGVADSSGWVSLLQRSFPVIPVVNAGENGNTSREGLARFEKDVAPWLPATVIVTFGGNDPVNEEPRRVGLEEFRENLLEIVRRVRAADGQCLLGTFPAIVSAHHSTAADPYFVLRGGLDSEVENYRLVVREIADRERLPLWDLDRQVRGWMVQYGNEAIIAADGIHWTELTNEMAANAVAMRLSEFFPGFANAAA